MSMLAVVIVAMLQATSLLNIPPSLAYYSKCQPSFTARVDVPIPVGTRYRIGVNNAVVQFGRIGSTSATRGRENGLDQPKNGIIFLRIDDKAPVLTTIEPISVDQTIAF